MSSQPTHSTPLPARAKPNEVATPSPETPVSATPLHPTLAVTQLRLAPRALTPQRVMQLQRTLGNRAVARLLQPCASRTAAEGTLEASSPEAPVGTSLLQAKLSPAREAGSAAGAALPNSPQAVGFTTGVSAQGTGSSALATPSVHTPEQAGTSSDEVREIPPRPNALLPTARATDSTPAMVPHDQTAVALRPVSPTGDVLQGKFTYASGVVLERGGGTARTPDQFTVETIALPEKARPPTQFGREQKAHSVSWTLVRRAYQEVGNKSPKLNARTFIENYLIPDWETLAKQAKLAGSRDEHETFQNYLDKYKPGKLTGWKTASLPALQWHTLLQETVRDYFLAFQLAPLTTHTGFTQKKGGLSEGVKESRPSSHGEPAANKFFAKLENSILGVEKAPTEKAMSKLTKHALAYWDPGIEMVGGIHDPLNVAILLEEYKKNFMRAYPLTWLIYGGKIVSAVETEIKESFKRAGSHGKFAEKEEEEEELEPVEEEEEEAEAEEEEEITTDPGGFAAQVGLSTTGETKVEASGFTVKALHLPDDRPPTKYGPLGQKSHTVSWTLVLKGLRQLALNQPLSAFLQIMLLKWQNLAVQPWDAMQTTDLIASGDYKGKRKPMGATIRKRNQENKSRLRAIQAGITANIQATGNALGGEVRGDMEWATFVQQMVGDYMVAYQSAPFTAFKSREGTPKGHGESDSNRVFGILDQDTAAAVGDEWAKKLQSLYTGMVYTGSDPSDAIVTAPLILKINKGEKLEEEERERLRAVVVKELALNYLDTEWNALRVKGTLTLATAPQAMARIVVEWEELLRAAYPRIWTKYKTQFEAYSHQLKLPPSLLAEKAHKQGVEVEALAPEDTRMESTIKAQRGANDYERGLIAAQSGDTAVVETDPVFFAQAKAEYLSGLNAIRAGTPALADTGTAKIAKTDYTLGESQALAGDTNSVGPLAFKRAKTDYQAGVTAARAGQPKGTGAAATGFDHYEAGVKAAKQKNPELTGGHQLGYSDFTQGFSDHSSGLFVLPQHLNRTGYMAGWSYGLQLAERDEEVVREGAVLESAKKKSKGIVGDNN
jgi:hypothetical protein